MTLKNMLLTTIVLIACLSVPLSATIWDNILSQTGASHPINLTESFNIDFELPQEYELDGNLDFNSQLRTLTMKLSKNLIIQDVNIIKAQIDLNQLTLNIDQFLLGCEKFRMGIDDDINDKLKEKVSNVGLSKRYLFLVNLFFKYIGRYEPKKLDTQSNKPNKESNIFDLLKGNKIFDQIEQAFGGNTNNKEPTDAKFYDMFQFSVNFFQNSKDMLQKIEQGKEKAKKHLNMDDEDLDQFDLPQLGLDMLKFVVLTNPKTGEIVKAYKNRQMKEEMKFMLKSNEKSKVQCNKQAKKLTFEDLTNGAKYLYDNKDTLGNVLNN